MKKRFVTSLLSLSILMAGSVQAEDRFADVKIEPTDLGNSVYMLKGSGGNIGVSAGDEGILIVDDQFAPLADKISAALKAINPSELKYVINTHFHGDHTGANGVFSKQAVIMAHDNVRVRLLKKENADMAALPVVTYSDGIKVYINGEEIVVKHLPPGHTDGDSIVFFKNANVLHAGDLFFKDRFPFVDLKGGGSVTGYLKNVKYIIANFADDVTIIPGHGDLAKKADYQRVEMMLEDSIKQANAWIKSGTSVEEAKKQGLGDKWKDWSWGFISQDRWIDTLYNDLK